MSESDGASDPLPRSVTMDLWREALSASLSQIVAILTTFALAIILTRSLSPSEVGVYYFIYAIVLLLTQVDLGMGEAVRNRVSAGVGKQARYFWSGILLTGCYALGVGILTVGVGRLAEGVLTRGIFVEITQPMLALAFLAFVGKGTLKLSQMYLAGLGYPGRADWFGAALPSTITAGLSLVVAQFLGGGVVELLGVLVGSYCLSTCLILLAAQPPLPERPTLETMRSLLRFARWSIPNAVFNDFYHQFDTFLLGFLVGAVSVGYYDASVRMVTLGFAVSFGLGAATSVHVSGRRSQNLPVEPVLRSVTEAAAIATFPLVVGFALIGDAFLIGFYGPEYELAFYYLVGIAIQQVLQGYRVTFEGFFEGLDVPRRNFRASLVAVGVNLVTAVPLVLWLGGIGVVVSSIIADLARLGAFGRQLRAQLEGGFAAPRLVFVQGFVALGVYLLLRPLLDSVPQTLLTGLGTMGLVFILYFGVLIGVSPKVRQVFAEAATRVIQMCW